MAAKLLVLSLLAATAYGSGGFSSFSYGVSDPRTGDVKDQHEQRNGGHVVGQYSLLEADGTKRVVEYQADDATGFKAIVHKEPAGGPAGAHNAHLTGGGLGHGAGAPLASSHLSQTAHSGALTNHHLANSARPNYAPYNAGYGNPAPGSHSANGAPAVSSYSHMIVHDVSRPYAGPHAGAFGGYGAHGALAGRFGHGVSNSLTNGWSSPNENRVNGWASPRANNEGWSAPRAVGPNGWASSVENFGKGWSSSAANGANGWSSSRATGNNGWAPAGANAWPSSLNAGVNGWSAPLAKGANGWPSPIATGANGWTSSYANGAPGWSSPAGATGFGANLAW